MRRNMRKEICQYDRNPNGVMGSLLMVLGIFGCLLFACLAVDVAHYSARQAEMQKQVDAGAVLGCYDLSWNSTRSQVNNADSDVVNALIAPMKSEWKSETCSVNEFSCAGGSNNGITVVADDTVSWIFAPILCKCGLGNIHVSATAAQMPILMGSCPPWVLDLNPANQPGKGTVGWAGASPPQLQPTWQPPIVNLVFVDPSRANSPPPVKPYVAVNMAVDSPSGIAANATGAATILQWVSTNGRGGGSRQLVTVNDALNPCDHSTYDSTFSAWQNLWSSGKLVVLLPVIDSRISGNKVIGFEIVQLTGPMLPGSYSSGAGPFGEWQAQILNSTPGYTTYLPDMKARPHDGTYDGYSAGTVATLIR